MPSVKQTVSTSGLVLWNAHEHKVAELVGLRIDNAVSGDIRIDLLDCFSTDASKANATGAAQASEDFETYVASGKVRWSRTLVSGVQVSEGPSELKEVSFLGKAYVRGSLTTSDAIVVASYKLK
jgi:hypothetical protein